MYKRQLHISNALLLACLLARLGQCYVRQANVKDRRPLVAGVLAAALWALHPLLASTTLYIVQREAMLSTFFVLLGLLAWLHGRHLCRQQAIWSGLAWVALGLGGCTILGTLSKANGILLPALALTIEYALLRPTQRQEGEPPRAYRRLMILVSVLPSLGLIAYLGYEGWRGMAHGISAVRPWTLGQRLLTEPRVLIDYLAQLWVPRPYSRGLFNDHIQASTSLIAPWSTLPSLLALLGLGVAGWLMRCRHPALAVAILFYLVGQLLESSTIALELYFEHRNYLPAMLMFWPLALWLCSVQHPSAESRPINKPSTDIRLAKGILAGALVIGLACMTHAAADLWGNGREQALLWAAMNPTSPRAQASAAQVEMQAGRPDLAAIRLTSALTKTPQDVQLAINLVAAECQMGDVPAEHLEAAKQALAHARDSGTLLSNWFGRAIVQSQHPRCPQLNLAGVDALVEAALSNPRAQDAPGRLQDLYSMKGQIALADHVPDEALAYFNRALDQQVRATTAFQQAALLGNDGYPRQALAHLAYYENKRNSEYRPNSGMPALHQWVLDRQHYWDRELARLQATLREDAERQAQTHS
ncbi:tetratricopeptide repeat protein [Dyella sp. ASV21]|uniref:tetratricopeptide repeat protein n=1 Tax=Dyella sp. ASV21 TaxID=2795114 RepID=UPI002105821C|nr:tetratricopeptide repeat protein [Dyella sp. ASV21]